jgi:hypothetical protein
MATQEVNGVSYRGANKPGNSSSSPRGKRPSTASATSAKSGKSGKSGKSEPVNTNIRKNIRAARDTLAVLTGDKECREPVLKTQVVLYSNRGLADSYRPRTAFMYRRCGMRMVVMEWQAASPPSRRNPPRRRAAQSRARKSQIDTRG